MNSASYQDWIRASSDPYHFITEYCSVSHPTLGRTKMISFPYVRALIKHVQEHPRAILLMPRQTGETATVLRYFLWQCLHRENWCSLVVASKIAHITGLVELIENLPENYREHVSWMNQNEVRFKNNSSLEFVSYTGLRTASCGRTVDSLYLSGASYVLEDLFNSALSWSFPFLPPNATVVIGGNGCSWTHPFAQLWIGAKNCGHEWSQEIPDSIERTRTPNGFAQFYVNWRSVPFRFSKVGSSRLMMIQYRDEEFKSMMLDRGFSPKCWNREFECLFD